ncbi:hypothetical protein [Nostoc sp. MS1]|uniref:hypothetical protein n=1 Tax=Nostoc sp. MS1 TaxID=2764711 RepID=UPI001CC411D0|nr:hypothetical protein [Nostoc sp. MS1]
MGSAAPYHIFGAALPNATCFMSGNPPNAVAPLRIFQKSSMSPIASRIQKNLVLGLRKLCGAVNTWAGKNKYSLCAVRYASVICNE